MPRALVVDDKAENLYFLAAMLRGNGYSVDQARNGFEALASARAHPPDLAISDILMPGMDGFALCRQWKQDPQLQRIPFVFYTATYTEPKDQQLALSLGADVFLIKPQEPEAFMEEITKVLQRRSAGNLLRTPESKMDEADYLREYNAALIRKLEDKLVQLKELNRTLEERVAERTALAEERAAQLRELAARLSDTEDRERRRLAEILHDDLQQLLAGAQMHLAAACNQAQSWPALEQRLGRVKKLVDQSLHQARDLSHQLSPPTLYQVGLIHTLDWLARQMQENYDLEVAVDAGKDAEPNDVALRTFLFKSIQELLNNVVKHAGTDRALIRVTRQNGHLVVEVSDQGKGIDARRLASGPGSLGGFGLFNIQQRTEQMGGSFHIQSGESGGARIVLTVPDHAPGGTGASTAVLPPSGTLASRADTNQESPSQASMQGQIRLLLADDHEIMREGLASLLGGEADMKIIGHASNGREAVELAGELHPDVILMDVTMPIMDGFEATRQIKASLPDIRIIGLSMHDRADMAQNMHRAGADAYLSKDGSADALLAAIRRVAASPVH